VLVVDAVVCVDVVVEDEVVLTVLVVVDEVVANQNSKLYGKLPIYLGHLSIIFRSPVSKSTFGCHPSIFIAADMLTTLWHSSTTSIFSSL
jgi:hypothetical protein